MQSLFEQTATIELSPYQVGIGRQLHHSPPISLPYKTLDQLGVVPFLHVDIEVADVGGNLNVYLMDNGENLVQIECGESILMGWVYVAKEGIFLWIVFAESERFSDSCLLLIEGSTGNIFFILIVFAAEIVNKLLTLGLLVENQLIEFGLAIYVPCANAVDRKMIASMAKYLYILRFADLFSSGSQSHPLDMVIQLGIGLLVIKTGIFEYIFQLLIQCRLHPSEIFLKLFEMKGLGLGGVLRTYGSRRFEYIIINEGIEVDNFCMIRCLLVHLFY